MTDSPDRIAAAEEMTDRIHGVHARLMAMVRARDEIGPDAPERAWLSGRIVHLIDELHGLYQAVDARGPESAGPPTRP